MLCFCELARSGQAGSVLHSGGRLAKGSASSQLGKTVHFFSIPCRELLPARKGNFLHAQIEPETIERVLSAGFKKRQLCVGNFSPP